MSRGYSRRGGAPALTTGDAPKGSWTPAQAAEYAARRDYLLLKQLARDGRTAAMAQRLGIFSSGPAGGARMVAKRPPPGNKRSRRPSRRASQGTGMFLT